MTHREKQFVIGGAVLLGLIVVFQVFVRPAISRVRTLRRVVADKRKTSGELQTISREYNVIRSHLEQIRQEIGQQREEEGILSFIERIQKDCGLAQKVVYMKPTTTTISDIHEERIVEVKFGAVTLEQLIQFLSKIESSQLPVGIKVLDIKRETQNPRLLAAVVQVASLSTIEQDDPTAPSSAAMR